MSLPGFPPATPPPRIISFKALVDDVDRTRDVPVTYAFGGTAPTTVPAEDGVTVASNPANAARWFVEYDPYYWLPA